LRSRYYDPEVGRFISEDSYWGKSSDPLSLNLYTYCQNDPIQYYDPSGHDGESILAISLIDGPEPGPADAVAVIYYAGYNVTIYGPKAVEFVGKYGPVVLEKAKEAGGYVADKASQGANYVKDKVSEGFNWIKSKLGMDDSNILNYGSDQVAKDVIGKYKKGSINREFPAEYLDKTMGQIEKDAKAGNKTAQKAKKLLQDKDFDKGSNSTRSKKGK
jgi:uncharacterized protein RhaS with RHS repeats